MEALLSEVERNLEIAGSTKKLIDRERDMLQGDVEERLIVHRFHTDAWDSLVNAGGVEGIGSGDVNKCYMHLKEVNEILDWFNRRGNRIAHVPVLESSLEGYGRAEVLDILREKCDEAEVMLRDARQELESVDL